MWKPGSSHGAVSLLLFGDALHDRIAGPGRNGPEAQVPPELPAPLLPRHWNSAPEVLSTASGQNTTVTGSEQMAVPVRHALYTTVNFPRILVTSSYAERSVGTPSAIRISPR